MRTYELIFIFDPAIETDMIEGNLTKIQDLIIAASGIIRKWERWGKRRLTYEIQAKQYGYYVLVVFDVAASDIAELERSLRHSPAIIRHLVTVVDLARVPEIDIESVKTMGAAEIIPEPTEEKPVLAEELEEPLADIEEDVEPLIDTPSGDIIAKP